MDDYLRARQPAENGSGIKMRPTSRQQSIGSYQEVKSLGQIDPFQQPSPDYIPQRIRGVFGAAVVVVVVGY